MINIIGNILGCSGYDVHCRELANALSNLTEVSLTTNLIPEWETMVTDKELQIIKKEPGDINLIITNPMNWKMHTEAKRNWAFLIWEGDKVPESYLEECMNTDIEYIFVPSYHTKQAIENALNVNNSDRVYRKGKYIMNKIRVMPHGVDVNKFYPTNKLRVDNLNNENVVPFKFIANKGFRNLEDRGGIQYLIQAYLEEFKKENVELIIKINPAYGIPDLNKITKELGYTEESPNIGFDVGNYKYEDLVKFYNQGNVFVSPTRAEAFNLGGIEAKSCGLMTIQTAYGGQTDYMVEGTDLFVDFDMTEVTWEVQYEGCRWATPKIEDLRKKMRWCYENQEEVKKRGKQARKEAIDWSWNKTAKKIVDLI